MTNTGCTEQVTRNLVTVFKKKYYQSKMRQTISFQNKTQQNLEFMYMNTSNI